MLLQHQETEEGGRASTGKNVCLVSVDRMWVNGLKRNPDKAEVLLISQKADQDRDMANAGWGYVSPENSAVQLGLLLDSSLSLSETIVLFQFPIYCQLKMTRRHSRAKVNSNTLHHSLISRQPL